MYVCGQLRSPATLSRERNRVDTNNDLDAWEKRKLHCLAGNRSIILRKIFVRDTNLNLTYNAWILTYLLHGAESFLSSYLVCS